MSSLSTILRASLHTLLLGVAVSTPVWAEVAQPIKIDLKAYRIVTQNGKETASEAKQARPGDVIEYRATYANVGATPVANLLATLPIPNDMEFTGATQPTGAEASTDGKTFAPMPLKRTVAGKVVEVPLIEYRALRWKIATLPAGKTAVVSVRTRVNGSRP